MYSDRDMPDSPSRMSSFIAPWVETHSSSMARVSVSSVLSGTSLAACHRVHRSIMWKMMCLWMKSRSHSTCELKVSATSTLLALDGPGLAHSLHTWQV